MSKFLSIGNIHPAIPGLLGSSVLRGMLTRLSRRTAALAFAISCACFLTTLWGQAALADSFDESPPAWEFLLWGGKPVLAVEAQSASHPATQPKTIASTPEEETGNPTPTNSDSTRVAARGGPAGGEFVPQFAGAKSSTVLISPPETNTAESYIAPFRTLTLRNIPPLYVTPQLPGEGVWSSQGMPAGHDGQPIIYRTSYRPSVEYANAIVHMLLFDMKRLKMRLYIGSSEPWAGVAASSIEPDLKRQLVCVTNALWKQKHSGEGGAVFRGKVLKPLTPGVATIVAYNDDSVDILEWNDGIPTSMIRDARQLRHLIVKDGKVVDSVIKAGKKADSEIGLGFLLSENEQPAGDQYWWGGYGSEPATNYGSDWFIATRSAFGVRADGNLVFAIGHHISTKDLAKALVLAGCERAIHADSNPHNVVGNLYYTNPDGTIVKKTKLSPDQKSYTLDRYDRSYTSDFFGIFLKLGSGEAS
jgi:hypothetical protein